MEHLNSSQDLARMLADYRANGGRIRQKEAGDPFGSAGPAAAGQNRAADALIKPLAKADNEEEKTGKQGDISWTPKVSHSSDGEPFIRWPLNASLSLVSSA